MLQPPLLLRPSFQARRPRPLRSIHSPSSTRLLHHSQQRQLLWSHQLQVLWLALCRL